MHFKWNHLLCSHVMQSALRVCCSACLCTVPGGGAGQGPCVPAIWSTPRPSPPRMPSSISVPSGQAPSTQTPRWAPSSSLLSTVSRSSSPPRNEHHLLKVMHTWVLWPHVGLYCSALVMCRKCALWWSVIPWFRFLNLLLHNLSHTFNLY